MPLLPAEPILRAARRWAAYLRHSSVKRTHSVFVNNPDYLDLTPTQYGLALSWLKEIGAIAEDGSLLLTESLLELNLFEKAVLHAAPLWLRDADHLIISPNDLPQDAAAAGDALGLSIRQTTAAVHAAWSKVDTTAREQIGSAGEEALTALLNEVIGVKVSRVSEYADWLGYDVAVDGEEIHLKLEVKTTTRRGRLTIYLSRNEYEVMLRDLSWRLAVVYLGSDQHIGAIGTVTSEWIHSCAPIDTSPLGRWEAVRLDIPPHAISLGLADLSDWADSALHEQHLLRTGLGQRPPAWICKLPPTDRRPTPSEF